MTKILLLEDDKSFGYVLSEYLRMQDFEVDWVRTGEESIQLFENSIYDLAILDIMLPGMDGYEVAAKIKQQFSEVPFVFLSAKALKIDKLKGYKIGAFDYLTKPVDEEILVAKIHALLSQSNTKQDSQQIFNVGIYTFNASTQQLTLNGGVQKLTRRESELLELFINHKGKLLSRDYALKKLWSSSDEFSRKSMDVYISHLRKYLSKDENISIINVHGKGFIFNVGK